ncbi:hypothetical protein HPB50_010206 [Hyalomma asiaticum]|uniref:Uncharacterized protein n=1 Tax=Hyalomma asiaticum TaxID=266040 RepID=A0ACB7RZ46_HYAAI|nr:hypothetical protein HPB50_010206 [Hyalomma asiaticum]
MVSYTIFYWVDAVLVRLYLITTPVCTHCGLVSHRTDVCPSPNVIRCSTCGTLNPEAAHELLRQVRCVTAHISQDPTNASGSTDESLVVKED